MNRTDHRWLGWSILISLLLVCLLIAGVLAFWYVVWPFSPGFVRKHTQWTIPFVRASVAFEGMEEGREGATEEGLAIWDEVESRFRQLVMIDPHRVQSDLVTCLQGHDQEVRREALDWVYLVAEQTSLEPELCAEIVRATNEAHHSDVWWKAVQVVQYLPDAEPRLISMFESGDEDFQFAAVMCLPRMGNRALTKRILPLLQDSRIEVRRWALRLLSLTRDPAATSAVTPFLEDPDQDARMWAGKFLHDVNQPFE